MNDSPNPGGEAYGIVELPPGSQRLCGTVALAHQAHVTRVRLVAEARHTFGMAAARQLWLELGLPVVPAMEVEALDGPGGWKGVRPAGDQVLKLRT